MGRRMGDRRLPLPGSTAGAAAPSAMVFAPLLGRALRVIHQKLVRARLERLDDANFAPGTIAVSLGQPPTTLSGDRVHLTAGVRRVRLSGCRVSSSLR